MNNIEEKLSRITTKNISEDEKNSLWHKIATSRVEEVRNKNKLSVNIFNFTMKKYIAGFIALVVILGGGGVVAASNSAIPGDFLFPVDLAIEKIQIKLSSTEKGEELKFRFTEERVEEIKVLAEKKGASVLVTDLSKAQISEIEAEIFDNETLVKIEANNKKYGFITDTKIEADIIKEIASKYSLTEEGVKNSIKFTLEDRDSRADDKKFLNKTNSLVFSSEEDEDVSEALTSVNKFLLENSDPGKSEKIQQALTALLVLLGDDSDVRIERKDDEIKIKSDSGKIKIELEEKVNDKSGKNDDDSSRDEEGDDELDDSKNDEISDVREDDSEVFCRGEWRDQEDCDESSNDEDEDEDEDDNDDDDEEDDDEDADEDNSGQGGGDDN